MVQVYADPLCKRYYGSIFGEVFLFRVVAYLGAIVLALVVAFATGGFWIKLSIDSVQASVRYTYDALLIFEGAQPGQTMVWSTSPTINQQYTNYFAATGVEVGQVDLNDDGKVDIISFSSTTATTFPVHGIKALLQFHYQLSGNLQLDMYSLAYVQHSSPVQGGALHTDGELLLSSKVQLTAKSYNSDYNVPILNSTAPSRQEAVQPTAQLQMQSILRAYSDRNFSTTYTNAYPVWTGGTGDSFVLDMRIRIPPNQVTFYRPRAITMLKGGWVQWLATYLALWWLLRWAEHFLITNRVLEARVVSDLQQRKPRF